MAQNDKKVSKEQFLFFLRKNGGIYARTAKDIEKSLNITYTRQAVYNRAQRLDP